MPYHRELKVGNKILVSKMLLISKADAKYVAAIMNASCNHNYVAAPRFLGYEGVDYCLYNRSPASQTTPSSR